MIPLVLFALAVTPLTPPTPGVWPAPFEHELAAHFGEAPPVRPSAASVDALIEAWRKERPTGVDVLLDERWQGPEVYLLDGDNLARIAARVDLHALFPFAGRDAEGRPFAMRAALLGRGRFAFVYPQSIDLHIPAYPVLGSDSFSLGALDLGVLRSNALRTLQAFDAPGVARAVEGPFGVAIAAVFREGEIMRVRSRAGLDVRVRALRAEPIDSAPPPVAAPPPGQIQAK